MGNNSTNNAPVNGERNDIDRRNLIGVLSEFSVAAGAAALLSSGEAHATRVTVNPTGTDVFKVYDVTDYGAFSDGTNPSTTTTAIQNTINAAVTTGGVVYFPRGTFATSSQINVTGKVVLLGAGGSTATTTISGSQTSGHMFNVTGHAVEFRGFNLINNGTGRVITTTSSSSVFGFCIQECIVQNIADNDNDMLYLTGSYSLVDRCGFSNQSSNAYAIKIDRTESAIHIESRVTRNTISGRGIAVTSAVTFDSPQGLKIHGNFFNLGFEQVTIRAVFGVDIAGNSFANSTGYGIYIDTVNTPVQFVQIRGNTMDTASNTTAGICIYCPTPSKGVRDVLIGENTISFCGYGIVLNGAASATNTVGGTIGARIVNNVFASIAIAAIALTYVQQALISGNKISGLGAAQSYSITGGLKGSGTTPIDFIIIKMKFLSPNVTTTGLNGTGAANYINSDNMIVT